MKKTILILSAFLVSFTPARDVCEYSQRPIYRTYYDYQFPGVRNQEARYQLKEQAIKYRIDPCVLYGIAMRETGGRHWKNGNIVRGASGEYGIMQVMPYNFRKSENPHSIQDNIQASARYLARCYAKYQKTERALSCYNRGEYSKKINQAYVDYIMPHVRSCKALRVEKKALVRVEKKARCPDGKFCEVATQP